MRIVSISTAALILTGCATPYQETTWWNDQGVSAKQITRDTLMVSAKGSAFTSPDTIEQYALRKAAEATLAAGNDWFAPASSKDRTSTGVIATSFGRTAFAAPVSRPGASITVHMGKNPKPEGAYDAREVVAYLTPKPKPKS